HSAGTTPHPPLPASHYSLPPHSLLPFDSSCSINLGECPGFRKPTPGALFHKQEDGSDNHPRSSSVFENRAPGGGFRNPGPTARNARKRVGEGHTTHHSRRPTTP